MRKSSIAIVKTMIVACSLTCPLFVSRGEQQDSMATRVSTFAATGVSPLEALLMLGNQQGIPLAIVCSDNLLLNSSVDVDEHESDLKAVLGDILRAVPTYSAALDKNNVVMIADMSKVKDNPLLNFSFPHFGASRALDATDISERLWGEFQIKINPKRKGYGGVLLVPPGDIKLPPPNFDDATIGDVLDWVVKQHKTMAWLMWPTPEHLVDAKQYRLWNFVYYYSPGPSANKLCCVYIPSDIGPVPDQVRTRLELH